MIPINQILNQVKDKSWLKRLPPLKSDLATRDTTKYYVSHGTHKHYTGDCKSWKTHIEELVRDAHCTEFVTKKAFQQIEDHDASKEPSQKVIQINTNLADSKGVEITGKDKRRKIEQATVISEVLTSCRAVEDDNVISF